MRRLILLGCVVLVAGCGGSTAATPTSTPRISTKPQPIAVVGTIPQTTPVARTKAAGATKGAGGKTPVMPPPQPLPTATRDIIPASAFTALLYGTVTDAKTHSPLPGARISVIDASHTTQTDSFGRYSIHFPATRFASVQVSMHGYAGQLTIGRLSAHKRFQLSFQLSPIRGGTPVAPPPPAVFGSH